MMMSGTNMLLMIDDIYKCVDDDELYQNVVDDESPLWYQYVDNDESPLHCAVVPIC